MKSSLSYLPSLRGVWSRRTALLLLLILPTLTPLGIEAAPPDPRPDLHQPQIRAAVDVQEWHIDRLLALPDVVGSGIALDTNKTPIIRLFVKRAGIPNLPNQLSGIPVQIAVIGQVFALPGTELDPTARHPRPVPTGVSVGHPDITAGTLGARVHDAAGTLYILSNNHVLADNNAARINRDHITQPGSFDGGTLPEDDIATLDDYVVLDFSGGDNLVDAAIARTDAGRVGNATLPDGYGTPAAETVSAYIDQPVRKCGRTTGCTQGAVSELAVTVNVCYEGTLLVCTKAARFVDQIAISSTETFSSAGDSGSLIVTDTAPYNPVALLFAGSASRTFGNPIDAVLTSFNVSIDGSTGTGDPGPDPEQDVILLSAQGYKVKGRHHTDLSWSGTAAPNVDIWRDGQPLVTTANTGSYTDATDFRGNASYQYKVCAATTTSCSNEVSISF